MSLARTALLDADERAPRWWSRSFRMFQTNLREIDAGLDVERTLDAIEETGADTWLVNAGGILAFHPTDLPFQTRNPLLAQRPSGDLLGDAVAAAHARGVRLLARMDFSKVPRRLAEQHPEWAFVSPDGAWQEYNGLVSVTPTGAYYQDRSLDILDEVIDRYPVDGFFFNWFGFSEVDYDGRYRGVCHAETTRRAFADETGLSELPHGPDSPLYPVWRRFADGAVERLTGRIRDHIRARRPDAGLVLGRSADIRFHEANNAVGREFWPVATSAAVSALRSAAPDVPVLVNSVAFLDMPYRMAAEQPEAFAAYVEQAVARGANPSIYVMGPPGAVPYPGVAAAAPVLRVHRDHRALYDDLVPSAVTGLVRPVRGDGTRERHAEAVDEFRGLYSALQERHLPFDVVGLESLDATDLARYSLLVLPDTGPLAPATVATLDAWVHAGGRLLATGATAVDAGRVQLACLPGTHSTAERAGAAALRSTYVAGGPADADAPLHTRAPVLPLYGRRLEMAWKPDAEHHLAILGAAPFGPPELAHGNAPTGEPGYAVLRTGAGRAVHLQWTAGRAYRDLALSAVRDLVVAIAHDLLDGAERLSAELPEQVELTVQRSGSATVVHLLNQTGVRRTGVGRHVPVHDGVLRIRNTHPGVTVRALVAGLACAVRRDEAGTAVVALPPLERFEVLEIREPAPGGPEGPQRAGGGAVEPRISSCGAVRV